MQDRVGNPLSKLTLVRLRADRDIKPEEEGVCDQVGEGGENATQLVEWYLNQSDRHDLVEDCIITDLNRILQPDWTYQRIFPKRVSGGNWELGLEDSGGNLVPLSHTGSGVKTLLLVLINLHLVPHA